MTRIVNRRTCSIVILAVVLLSLNLHSSKIAMAEDDKSKERNIEYSDSGYSDSIYTVDDVLVEQYLLDMDAKDPDRTKGPCDCSSPVDFDCHYEMVPAFMCIADNQYEGTYTSVWWLDVDGNNWGVKDKVDVYPSEYLYLHCPLPSDGYSGSKRYYGDIAGVWHYFYHDNSSYYSYSWLYSYGTYSTSVTYHGGDSVNGGGHVQTNITPSGTVLRYPYTKVRIQNENSSSFHGVLVCYDTD